MKEENNVTLHGMWASPYVKRVELDLKEKGIPMKSTNTVHNGNQICESSVIIEYIDETWKNESPLFPQDPYQRIKVRFWASYIHQVYDCMLKVFRGKEALEGFYAKLSVLEDGINNFSLGITSNMNNIGMLDIMIVITLGAYRVQEEVFGFKLLEEENTSLLYSWVTTLIELPIVKGITPPHEKVVSFLQYLKNKVFKAPPHAS
uniref:Glutathione S-transferase n=1 Tax=Solanum lycopersicum TaxID=4081 RepID=A0A3Q7H9N6_SOLLC